MSTPEVVLVGDVHRQWHYLHAGLARLARPPRSMILLGDLECHAPLDELAAPFLRAGIAVHWIFGNHDYDGGPEMWANHTDPARNPATAAGALHGRVVELGGLRVAGLGGIFRPRVWNPPSAPRLHARAELPDDMATLGPEWTDDQRASMAAALAAMAIWPEDVAALATQRADVLVTHEAPTSHPAGVAALEELARAMGAELIVHGHHHVNYLATAGDGLRAMGVGAGWGLGLDGRTAWHGEEERWLGRPPRGWALARRPG